MQLKLPLAPASEAHAHLWEALDDETRLVVLGRLVAMLALAVEVRTDEEVTNDD